MHLFSQRSGVIKDGCIQRISSGKSFETGQPKATHPEDVKVLIDLSSEDARPMWVVNTHFSHRSLTQNRRFVIFCVAKSYSSHTCKLSKTDVEEGPVGIWMCFRDAWRL